MMVKIDEREYLELVEQSIYLQALEAEGVDNWTWYSTAIQNYIQILIDQDLYLEDYLKAIGKIDESGLLDNVDIKDIAHYYVDTLKENQEEEAASN